MRKLLASLFIPILALAMVASPVMAQSTYYPGSVPSILPNYSYPVQTFTATSQTSTNLGLTGVSAGLIQVTGSSLTTVTWAINGSVDGGTTWFALGTSQYTFSSGSMTVPIASIKSSQTTTASSLYIVNLAGLTNVQFVTSGTFTATSVAIKLVASSNHGLL